jgi:hypothetical protein
MIYSHARLPQYLRMFMPVVCTREGSTGEQAKKEREEKKIFSG